MIHLLLPQTHWNRGRTQTPSIPSPANQRPVAPAACTPLRIATVAPSMCPFLCPAPDHSTGLDLLDLT